MKTLFITCLALCVSHITLAQEAVNFKLNPEIGKLLRFNMFMKTDIDGPKSVIMDMNMKMEMLPAKKENENFTIENIIKTIKADINAEMMTVSYNSEEESTDETTKMIGEQLSRIINKKISSIVSEKGKTIDVNLPTSFVAQGFDASSFSKMSPTFPDNEVTPGESWESITEVNENPLFSTIEMTSTFLEENDEGYVIDIQGKMLHSSGEEIGTMKGSYTLDKQTHFTVASAIKTTIEVQGSTIISDVEMTVD
ncbi:DUF6263 family protein [Sphingobacterium corticibacterium]|uniref:Lipid/polyisoprenoid-binding YceI-like domain-containing protein n=1 Tax=Sphingobacterium corticibacterium TaxID=2484746 RepID=A0A4Q6XUN3_9SPHI|nr:DUF6263 family protein [Sphingobacterium corticibacterium]RZF60337.1 hypothetical protein EWE74_14625 [Sphingobacterium corticibacterium]